MSGQIKDKEKKFFDGLSTGDYEVFTEASYNKYLLIFKESILPKKNELLLDLGCGSGAFSGRLSALGVKVFGVDISFNLLNNSRHKDKVSFISADIERLPFADKTFDIVVFAAVLHHFPHLDQAIKEARRVLKDNGRCFAFDPNNRHPVMWLYRNKKSPLYSSCGVTDNERLLTEEELNKLFKDNYFAVKTFAISGLSYKYVKSRLMRLFLPLYNFIDRVFARTALAKRHGSFIITIAYKL
ncbi:MAG: class I SAM-dependent methyltransferase [Candidatus Omnitrophica bacterium]|nr:class I SAM-dependent methyltransferase [Candidatus Omnitrophota bacterium]MDD5236613.1 class I SAM-dependent methyltransferase [Candidatus Omnitrophota bacterium]MDD5610184.1 class I SAM-dependent methyltransferase [Candidatus Omnitrophota bacterium]